MEYPSYVMTTKILTPAQVEQFIELGYTKVEQAIPPAQALAAQDFLWGKLEARGIKRDDRSTWTDPFVRIDEMLGDPVVLACMTRRLADAVEDVVGEGRWREYMHPRPWGFWPVNFARGADKPWDVPFNDWHLDGADWLYTVDAPHQGLLLLCIFSQIEPRGGGTLLAEGSHQVIARSLNRHPEGIDRVAFIRQVAAEHPWLGTLTRPSPTPRLSRMRVEFFMNTIFTDADGTRLRVVEATGSPGDIYLCHPFIYHSTSSNHSGRPRFICNLTTPLFEKMNLARPDGNHSPLEISIRNAIGSNHRIA